MPSNENTPKILAYIRENKKSEMLNQDISKSLYQFKKSIKSEVTSALNISEDNFKKSSEDIASFIRAIHAIDKIIKDNPSSYSEIFSSFKTMKDIQNFTKRNSFPELLTSDAVSYKILSEVKNYNYSSEINTYYESSNISSNQTSNIEDSSLNEVLNNNPNSNTESKNISQNNEAKSDNSENTSPNKITITNLSELDNTINKDNSLISKIKDSSFDKIENLIYDELKNGYSIAQDIIREWVENYQYKHSKKASNENTEVIDKKKFSKLVLLDEISGKRISSLYQNKRHLNNEISKLKEENDKLKYQIDDLTSKLNTYKEKLTDLSPKHIFSVEIKELNNLLNSNSSESQITVKDEILNRASKYIDENHLINITDVLSKDRDLKSEVVQIILLAFLHENSLF